MSVDGHKRSPAIEPGYGKDRSPGNAGKRYPVEVLTRREVDALLEACSPRSSIGLRNRALIVVLYRAGLRVSEAVRLHTRDVDADAGALNVRDGKGSKQRIVGMDPGAFAQLQLWLDRRAQLGLGRGHVFSPLGDARRPLHTSYVRHLLPRLAEHAGIEKRVHPHGLRHTHAAELAGELPVTLIREQLGHANVATTDRYLRHIRNQELLDAMRSRTWSAAASVPVDVEASWDASG